MFTAGEPRRRKPKTNFARYYVDVSAAKILDAKTERKLLRRYRRTKCPEARDQILKSCLRFVVKLATRYANNDDRLCDLISAGNEGLIVALDHFDTKRDIRFLSYATHWVLLYIRNELSGTNLVAMPFWRQKVLRKLSKAKTRALAKTGNPASDRELCQSAKITKAQLEHLRVEQFQYCPLEEANLSNDGIEQRTISKEITEILRNTLNEGHLTPKERFVVSAYYGFAGDAWSLAEIAEYLGISSERVRQIKEHALERLRKVLERDKGITEATELATPTEFTA